MPDPPYPHPSPGQETILLVEDERAVREMLARTLRERGYAVIEAADGFAGVQAAGPGLASTPLLPLTDHMSRVSVRS